MDAYRRLLRTLLQKASLAMQSLPVDESELRRHFTAQYSRNLNLRVSSIDENRDHARRRSPGAASLPEHDPETLGNRSVTLMEDEYASNPEHASSPRSSPEAQTILRIVPPASIGNEHDEPQEHTPDAHFLEHSHSAWNWPRTWKIVLFASFPFLLLAYLYNVHHTSLSHHGTSDIPSVWPNATNRLLHISAHAVAEAGEPIELAINLTSTLPRKERRLTSWIWMDMMPTADKIGQKHCAYIDPLLRQAEHLLLPLISQTDKVASAIERATGKVQAARLPVLKKYIGLNSLMTLQFRPASDDSPVVQYKVKLDALDEQLECLAQLKVFAAMEKARWESLYKAIKQVWDASSTRSATEVCLAGEMVEYLSRHLSEAMNRSSTSG